MRLFQNSGISPSYRIRLAGLVAGIGGFDRQKEVFLNDRYGAAHILSPVHAGSPEAFFTNGDDEKLQRAWARDNGLGDAAPLADILLAQIEHHKTEIFYNLDPFRYDASFVRRLPGHVRRKIAWRAAPGRIDFSGYDLVVCNFPSMRKLWEEQGARTAHFFPAHDPELDAVAANRNRDIDVLFFGGYSRHHQRRRQILEAVAGLSGRRRVVFHLDLSRYTPLAETPLGWFGPLGAVRRPRAIRKVSAPPVFGRAMYEQLGRAKIVVNASIDMAGPDRGNMRCFEAMGAGALLVSDSGNYPEPMRDGETMVVYEHPQDVSEKIERQLEDGNWDRIGWAGNRAIREEYSKKHQFERFLELA
ncbi:MAG: glycosyltransferase family 1 protein [Mesorhizobium sp.]|uniref:glycosyltransferase family protein n=1 Tax=unclassified Mesorhizobium TaxID=325217 RepID=UPI000FCADF46|nr:MULTISPECIES: glycosyltransferase [unclassified Mesorhizobium]RUV70448.1 glycosyltransferase family 1 protein [Mesorhizobium sp. M5C.F.Cr.IN.023.01.1.1]RWF87888.1 MAG: glycosyltransferase family 1 protein [Mesorhizobium sp.]RWF96849.1 MAG: glycosyltransferase family 1 protein [Mesorhizobium sp.]RWI41779.1 MAG: glycosyltransferase family 1 protein [Mesorhizobium sp.]RWI50940.1 MAG: glycosyltransferase family 1 protein [Mesorhizobium sp.]